MTNPMPSKTSAVTLAFNATGVQDDSRDQGPWRRRALQAMAERQFAHLNSLRPAKGFRCGD